MNKNTLVTLSEIEYCIRRDVLELFNEYLDLMNLDPQERVKIENAAHTTIEKLDQIKASKIKDLGEHVELEALNRMSY